MPLYAAILRHMWAVSWVSYNDIINNSTGSDNQWLPNKVKTLQMQANYYQHHISKTHQLSVHTVHHTFHTATHKKEMWTHQDRYIEQSWLKSTGPHYIYKHQYRQKHIFGRTVSDIPSRSYYLSSRLKLNIQVIKQTNNTRTVDPYRHTMLCSPSLHTLNLKNTFP